MLELQANEFARRLLIPTARLAVELNIARAKALQAGLSLEVLNSDSGPDYMGRYMQNVFEAPAKEIAKRIRGESELWPFKK